MFHGSKCDGCWGGRCQLKPASSVPVLCLSCGGEDSWERGAAWKAGIIRSTTVIPGGGPPSINAHTLLLIFVRPRP